MAPKGYNLIGIPRSGKYLHIIWKVYKFDKIQITMKYLTPIWRDTSTKIVFGQLNQTANMIL
jgi:hypothetical protein